ncbi:hypothetical protein FBR04_20440 [Betaproteobacteria bacterium PRO7]|nr:hypothetical protein [Betaproteobacteria bacterium PRO7]
MKQKGADRRTVDEKVAEIFADLQRRQSVSEYNDFIYAYKISGGRRGSGRRNGLLLWMALAHCFAEGISPPESLMRAFARYGKALLAVARRKGIKPADYAKALELQCGARALTAWQQADMTRRKVRALTQMNTLIRPPFDWTRETAAKACAPIAGVSPKALQRDHREFVADPRRARSDDAYLPTSTLQVPKKRKVR